MNYDNFHLSYSLSDSLVTSTEVQQPAPVEVNHSFFSEVTSAPAGFLILFTSLILLCCSLRQWKSTSETSGSEEAHGKSWAEALIMELPCTKCQYFKANRYLPCAVHPIQVLTQEAKDCSDFKAREPN